MSFSLAPSAQQVKNIKKDGKECFQQYFSCLIKWVGTMKSYSMYKLMIIIINFKLSIFVYYSLQLSVLFLASSSIAVEYMISFISNYFSLGLECFLPFVSFLSLCSLSLASIPGFFEIFLKNFGLMKTILLISFWSKHVLYFTSCCPLK